MNKQNIPRVVVEVDRDGLVDVACDQPVHVVVLKHYFNPEDAEDCAFDDIITVNGQQVQAQMRDHIGNPIVDAEFVEEVWKNLPDAMREQFANQFAQ